MAANRKYLLHFPELSEYLYRYFMVLPMSEKMELSYEEQKLIKDDKSIHHFVLNEPMEKLLFLYAKTGGEFTLNLGAPAAIEEAIESTRYQYDHDQKRLDSIGVITRSNVCSVSSRDVMATAIMCAQNCTTDVYKISLYTAKIVSEKERLYKKPYDAVMDEAHEGVAIVNKLLLEQLNALPWAQEVLGIDDTDIRILAALYNKKNGAMDLTQLSEMARSETKRKYVGRWVEQLEKKGYVTTDRPKEKKVFGRKISYMISTKGVGVLLRYLYYVWEVAFHEKC